MTLFLCTCRRFISCNILQFDSHYFTVVSFFFHFALTYTWLTFEIIYLFFLGIYNKMLQSLAGGEFFDFSQT